MLRILLVLAVSTALFVPSAQSALTANNYQAKREKYTRIQDHAADVARFFKNHPKPAASPIGKRVIREQKQAHRWASNHLARIERFVYSGRFMPYVWFAITTCESGTNPPNWRHNSGTYQGAFGFYHGSWDAFNRFGFPSEAYLATPEQQYRVALAIHDRYGFTGWGCA